MNTLNTWYHDIDEYNRIRLPSDRITWCTVIDGIDSLHDATLVGSCLGCWQQVSSSFLSRSLSIHFTSFCASAQLLGGILLLKNRTQYAEWQHHCGDVNALHSGDWNKLIVKERPGRAPGYKPGYLRCTLSTDCLFWQAELLQPDNILHIQAQNKHVLAHLMGEEIIEITLKCKMKVLSSLQCTSTEAQWRQAISVCAHILPALEALWVSSHALFHRATAVFPAGPLRVGRNLWRSCVN